MSKRIVKRPTNVDRLRAQLAALAAAPGPPRQRGTAMWKLAEQIAAATGDSVRKVFDRAVQDAVELQMREAFE